ncbi:hypothetical protein OAJ05_02415 [Verrucomicrobia bacterium]|nr:hypothetical protein [Verrucomicrobiota bacterium]
MFGKRYFEIRERLAEVVLGVGQLARECGGEILDPVTDGNFLKDLRKPFLFVVCGEVNAGKSALINALFATEICEVDAPPKDRDDKGSGYPWNLDEVAGHQEGGNLLPQLLRQSRR